MKKIFAVLFAFAAIGFILIGCASNNSPGGARDGQPAMNTALPAPASSTPLYAGGYAFGQAAKESPTSPEGLNLIPYLAEGNTVGEACTVLAFVPVTTIELQGTIPASELPPQGNGGPQGQWENGCIAGYGN